MTAIAVLGGGAWGTALADHLARKGETVSLWARDPDVVAEITRQRRNQTHLPGHQLAESLTVTTSAETAVKGCSVIVNATPSHAVRAVLAGLAGCIAADALVVNASKGIERESLTFMSGVVRDTLPGRRYVVLSGPSFADEVAAGQPTAVVAASLDPESSLRTQGLFSNSRFRVYTSVDVTGVEVGGALKNVIAIAAGVLDGMGLGHNPRAALITRGLAEMSRLGVALGADQATFAGLAGLGDLVLTCTGSQSRNRSLGVALGQGGTLAQYIATHRAAVEGVNAARAALELAKPVGVELPVTSQVGAVLFDEKPVGQAVADLMERALKSEQWT
ncbi:MAG TPA: NAD(P)H-dependent glycerol-3-phosphate dehydrogenase [Gemmatimonadales bacterium]